MDRALLFAVFCELRWRLAMGTAVAFLAGSRDLTGILGGVCKPHVVLGVQSISGLDTDCEVRLDGRVIESGKF